MDADLIISFSFVLLGLSVLWLVRALQKLKQSNQALHEQIESLNKDVAGLCSAAVKVDGYLASHAEKLADVFEKLNAYQYKEAEASPYHSVIERVRSGASANELIKECGLSREEAALLFKLHGTDNR